MTTIHHSQTVTSYYLRNPMNAGRMQFIVTSSTNPGLVTTVRMLYFPMGLSNRQSQSFEWYPPDKKFLNHKKYNTVKSSENHTRAYAQSVWDDFVSKGWEIKKENTP